MFVCLFIYNALKLSIEHFKIFFTFNQFFSAFCRKVQNESSTGSVSASKVRTVLTIAVETIDFDTQACVLRVKGRNIQENQYVKVMISPLFQSLIFFLSFLIF